MMPRRFSSSIRSAEENCLEAQKGQMGQNIINFADAPGDDEADLPLTNPVGCSSALGGFNLLEIGTFEVFFLR